MAELLDYVRRYIHMIGLEREIICEEPAIACQPPVGKVAQSDVMFVNEV